MLLDWYRRISLTWDMKLFYIHHILQVSHYFVKYLDEFLRPKTLNSKGEVETAFKYFLVWRPWEFYRTIINNFGREGLVSRDHILTD